MKIACPMCQNKLEVTESQVQADVTCSCGAAFTLEPQMYRAAANRRMLLVCAATGSLVALAALAAVLLLAPAKKQTAARPKTADATTGASATPASTASAQPPAKPATAAAVTVPASAATGPVARWKLDEKSGKTAADTEGRHPGALVGNPAWESAGGMAGGALSFNGTTDYVQIGAPFGITSNTLTITCWVKRNGRQQLDAGVVMAREDDTKASGIFVKPEGEIRYNWGGATSPWTVASGLTLPDNAWAFAALVITPNQATVYLGDAAGGLRSYTSRVPHAPVTFSQPFRLANDAYDMKRCFKGRLDDVRIYDRNLSYDSIREIYLGKGRDLP